jgi:hypothetical protein
MISDSLHADTTAISYISQDLLIPFKAAESPVVDTFQLKLDSLRFQNFFTHNFQKLNKVVVIPDSTVWRKSIFTGHQLKPQHHDVIPIKSTSYDWISIVLIFCLIIYTRILLNSRKRLEQIVKSAVFNRSVNQMIRDGNILGEQISFFLHLIFLPAIALFFYRIAIYFGFHIHSTWNSVLFFGQILGGLTIFYFLKMIVIRMIGNIFKNQQASNLHLINNLVFNSLIGLYLIPLLFICFYAPQGWESFTLYLTMGITTLVMVFRFIRILIIGSGTSGYSGIYLFLYLCTVEIVPYLIVGKAILNAGFLH